jgi:hypothetical protein
VGAGDFVGAAGDPYPPHVGHIEVECHGELFCKLDISLHFYYLFKLMDELRLVLKEWNPVNPRLSNDHQTKHENGH